MRKGQAFRNLVRRSRDARQQAIATIRQRFDGWFTARIGGPKKGRDIAGPTRRDVEDQIHDHYGKALHRRVLKLADKKEAD